MTEALHKIMEHWLEIIAIIVVFLVFVKSKKYYS